MTQQPSPNYTSAQPQQQAATPVTPIAPTKKSNTLVWVLGCCGIIFVTVVAVGVVFGYMGYNAVKDEIKYQESLPSSTTNSADDEAIDSLDSY